MENNLKVALVTYALEIGGVESFLMSLAEFFVSHGHNVDFVETFSKGEWSDEFSGKGYSVQTIIINPFESRISHVKRLAKQLSRYDVLLLNDAPFAQSVLSLLPSETIVFPILHNNLDSMINNVISNIDQWNNIICVSPSLKNVLIQKTSVPEKKIIVISNGVSVEKDWPKSKLNFNNINQLKLLFVGRVEQGQKGVLYLPEIIKKTIERKYINLHLTIIGDGPSMTNLNELIKSSKLENYISLEGSLEHDKVINYMRESHVLLMPSHYEGHPIVLMEAMANGVVPIVSKLKGHTDHVVDHGENGYLCRIGNTNDFSDAIIELANNYNKLYSMSKKSWEKIANDFSMEAMGSKYIALMKRNRKSQISRDGIIKKEILDDLPSIPHVFVRPLRRVLKLFGLWKQKI